jgi:hypothetical protein
MIGYKLTNEQAQDLFGQWYAPDQYFNPVQDIDGVYFIFDGEVDECVNQNFMWVKTLQPSEYVPPINTNTP